MCTKHSAHTRTHTRTHTHRAAGIDLASVPVQCGPTLWRSAQCPWTGYMSGKCKILHVFDLCWLSTLTQWPPPLPPRPVSVCVCAHTHSRTYFSTFPSKCPNNVPASKQIIAYTSAVVFNKQNASFFFTYLQIFHFLHAPGSLHTSLAKVTASKMQHKFSKYLQQSIFSFRRDFRSR